MRVAVTSLVRSARLAEPSGYLSVVDLEDRRVLARDTVPENPHRARDLNPRGGLRGAKGVSVHGDRFVLANSERLFVLGSDWRLEREISHPWIAGVHDVLAEADAIHVACTDCDLLASVSWEGELLDSWSWRSDPALVRALGFDRVAPFAAQLDHRDPLIVHTGVHDLVHLNGFARVADGLLVSFGRIVAARDLRRRARRSRGAAALVRLGAGRPAVAAVRHARAAWLSARGATTEERRGATSARVLLPADGSAARVVHRAPDADAPTHNVACWEDLLLYNDSAAGALVAIEPATGRVARRIGIPGAPSFPRGLARLDADRFLVGSQRPAAVHVVDVAESRVVDSIALGGTGTECVSAIAALPDSFSDPPPALWTAAPALAGAH